MRFNPSDGNEARYPLIPDGEYDFEVVEAAEAVSKAGNEMTKLTLKVWYDDGKTARVWDYLVAGPKSTWKIKQFCEAVGLGDRYNTGEIQAIDFEGRQGRVKIATQEASGNYPAKNVVGEYVDNGEPVMPAPSNGGRHQPIPDDEIPF